MVVMVGVVVCGGGSGSDGGGVGSSGGGFVVVGGVGGCCVPYTIYENDSERIRGKSLHIRCGP